ncbi:hypothetical protein FACS189449_03970 [Alphaproteobacteria bacterium]|nr:hypothetical protein FACS189449_03970 [Alphaproteobacteria bacterium]
MKNTINKFLLAVTCVLSIYAVDVVTGSAHSGGSQGVPTLGTVVVRISESGAVTGWARRPRPKDAVDAQRIDALERLLFGADANPTLTLINTILQDGFSTEDIFAYAQSGRYDTRLHDDIVLYLRLVEHFKAGGSEVFDYIIGKWQAFRNSIVEYANAPETKCSQPERPNLAARCQQRPLIPGTPAKSKVLAPERQQDPAVTDVPPELKVLAPVTPEKPGLPDVPSGWDLITAVNIPQPSGTEPPWVPGRKVDLTAMPCDHLWELIRKTAKRITGIYNQIRTLPRSPTCDSQTYPAMKANFGNYVEETAKSNGSISRLCNKTTMFGFDYITLQITLQELESALSALTTFDKGDDSYGRMANDLYWSIEQMLLHCGLNNGDSTEVLYAILVDTYLIIASSTQTKFS